MKKILIATLMGTFFSLNSFAGLDQWYSKMTETYEAASIPSVNDLSLDKNIQAKLTCTAVCGEFKSSESGKRSLDECTINDNLGVTFTKRGPIMTIHVDGDSLLIHEDWENNQWEIISESGEIFGYVRQDKKGTFLMRSIMKDKEGNETEIQTLACVATPIENQ